MYFNWTNSIVISCSKYKCIRDDIAVFSRFFLSNMVCLCLCNNLTWFFYSFSKILSDGSIFHNEVPRLNLGLMNLYRSVTLCMKFARLPVDLAFKFLISSTKILSKNEIIKSFLTYDKTLLFTNLFTFSRKSVKLFSNIP